jgi:hypothetical protein
MIHFCQHPEWIKNFLSTALLALVLLQFSVHCATSAAGFEVPEIQKASDILPGEIISGPHYKVRETVTYCGCMHKYLVDSDFGVFEVTGDFALYRVIREIGAIAALQQIWKGDALLNGLMRAAFQPIEFGANLVTHPVDTIGGIPKGIASFFQNAKTGLTTQPGKNEDGRMEQLLSVSSNKRRLARQLGIDVYSSNKVLQKELDSVASAASLGSITVSAVLVPVGGPVFTAVSMTRAAQELHDLVDQYPPQKLRLINQEKLEAMGMPEDLVTRFLDQPNYTATQKTAIVSSLEVLSEAGGRDVFVRQTLLADDEETADFFMRIAETMRGYHEKVAPILEISVNGPLVFARASNGTVMIALPLDHLMWTETASRIVCDPIARHKAMNPGLKTYDIWLTGTASAMMKAEVAKTGVKIVEKVGSRIEFTY